MFLLLALTVGSFLSSCDKNDEENTKIELYSYGPMPIARGAELRFIGNALDKVTSITLPGGIDIPASSFTSVIPTMITLTVPQNAVEGYVVLKTPEGDITTKTPMGFSEPISITTFTPATIKAGQELTITGDYLNLIGEVIFTDRIAVDSSNFVSKSRYEIKLLVPAEAQTGKIAVSNAAEDPIIIYSQTELTAIMPLITAISPNPVKAGANLTISGTDLDLATQIVFGGNKTATNVISQTATQIVVAVPFDAQDGVVQLVLASTQTVESAALVMSLPTITTVSPSSVKNGGTITVTGTNLDLIKAVTFANNVAATINTGTSTSMTITVPNAAVTGEISFTTTSEKIVKDRNITILSPIISDFSPSSGKPNTNVTITGTNLDLVAKVKFTGGIEGSIVSNNGSSLVVTIPVGAKTGIITLVAINGVQVSTTNDFTVNVNLPNFSHFTEKKGTPGQIITLNGTSMNLIKQIIFPGNVYATEYGTKTSTLVEVYVPLTVKLGKGQIKIITYEGEEGLLPELFFGGTDPIADPSLIISTVDDGYAGNWGGPMEIASDPAFALDGQYIRGTTTDQTGWSFIWGNNWYTFPSVTKAGYVFKFDMMLTKPFKQNGVMFQMEFGGNRVDLGSLGIVDGMNETTEGWITVTYDLAQFASLPTVIPSGGEWGLNFGWANGPTDISGLYLDNFRFEAKSTKSKTTVKTKTTTKK